MKHRHRKPVLIRNRKRVNPLKLDPSRTAGLRRAMVAELRRRFDRLRMDVVRLIAADDTLGLRTAKSPIGNTAWKFHTASEKVREFGSWLQTKLKGIVGGVGDIWTRYVQDGFKKGAGRAFDDVKRSDASKARGAEELGFYAGTRDQFLRSAFGRPEAVDKVKLLAGRLFTDLKGVTDQMATTMARVLTDGLVQGKSPRDIARDLSKAIDISRARAELIARTEIIRAHADGQLEALRQLGVDKVGASVEWDTAGDGKVCTQCSSMEGVVLTLDEAAGLIPSHPGCRCCWLAAGVGEPTEGQKRTRKAIKRAATKAGLDDLEVSEKRPRSVLAENVSVNNGYNLTPELVAFSEFLSNFNPDEPRDEKGMWTADGSISAVAGPGGERYRNLARGRTHEGVDEAIAKTLTREQAKDVLAWHDGMNMTGPNVANKNLPNETRPELTPLERGALQKYTYKNDIPLNRRLRGQENWKEGSPYPEAFFDEMKHQIDSAFAKAPVMAKPVKVVRGLKLDGDALEKFLAPMREAHATGGDIKLHGFSSTARPEGIAHMLGLSDGLPAAFRGNVLLKINAVHGLDMAPHSQLPGERELLLHDESRFRVRSHKTDAKGNHTIELDQLPPRSTTTNTHTGVWIMNSDDVDDVSTEEKAALKKFYEEHPEAAKKWLGEDDGGTYASLADPKPAPQSDESKP